MEYRRAGKSDMHMFIENRMEFVASISKNFDAAEFKGITKKYIEEHI